MNNLIISEKQTSSWRNDQDWYVDGKKNECEKYQLKKIEMITGKNIKKTFERLNADSLELSCIKQIHKLEDSFDWSENFDGKQVYNDKTMYFNLKMICSKGGYQKRSLKDVYFFMKYQLKFLKKYYSSYTNEQKIYFVNILDGEGSFKYQTYFNYLLSKKEYRSVKNYFYYGDLKSFEDWFERL